MAQQWEYNLWGPIDMESAQREEYLSKMNQLGESGWELVAVRNTISAGHPNPVEFFFKRLKEKAKPPKQPFAPIAGGIRQEFVVR
jgi:hypothetical protein